MKKRITCLLLALLLLLQMPMMVFASGGKIAAESREGVVRIISLGPDGYYSTGSGFGVGKVGEETDIFVTNHHVVYGSYYTESGAVVELPAVSVWIMKNSNAWNPATGLDTAQCIPCEIIYAEEDGYPDMAILEAAEPVPGRVALPLLDDKEDLEAGDTVYALGYPGSSDMLEATAYGEKLVADVEDVTITSGVVSRITTAGAVGNTRIIQHDASVNHGNSGGPLLDENGAVVGINTYTFGMDASSGDDASSGSVCISQVIDVLDDLDIYWEPLPESTNWLLIGIVAGVVVLIAVVAVILIVSSNKRRAAAAAEEARRQEAARRQAEEAARRQAEEAARRQASSAYDPRPRLQCLSGAFAGKRFSLDNSVRIGRDPNKNDLVVPATTQGVSSVHCVLMVDGNSVWLKDLGSTYGTYLTGGRRLSANESVQLQIGDRFWLGSENELFVIAPKGGI